MKAVLADLDALTAAHAAPDDFVDLGEAADFAPEMMDGECAT